MSLNERFCILPWMSVQLNQDGTVIPCCRAKPNFAYGTLHDKTLQEIWNDSSVREMRLKLRHGETLEQCGDCHAIEENGSVSSRQTFNRQFSNSFARVDAMKEDGRVDVPPIYLGLRFSNVCNLKCRSCSAVYSTSWTKEAKALQLRIPSPEKQSLVKSSEHTWSELIDLIPTLEAVYIAGGEPLLHEDHYRFLEKLIEAGRTDVRLEYNTNITKLTFAKWNALELWKEFDYVQVGASLDGAGPTAELLRSGGVWNDVVANLHRLHFLENVHVHLMCTVSAMNAFHLPVAFKEWIDRKILLGPGRLEINIVTDPSYLALSVLTPVERTSLRRRYTEFCKRLLDKVPLELHRDLEARLNFILASIPESFDHAGRKRFEGLMNDLDTLRGESFSSLVPELCDSSI